MEGTLCTARELMLTNIKRQNSKYMDKPRWETQKRNTMQLSEENKLRSGKI